MSTQCYHIFFFSYKNSYYLHNQGSNKAKCDFPLLDQNEAFASELQLMTLIKNAFTMCKMPTLSILSKRISEVINGPTNYENSSSLIVPMHIYAI